MADMCPAHGGDIAGVPRGLEPIVDRRTDCTTPNRRLPRSLMPGNKEQDTLAMRDRRFERSVDCEPGAFEAHSVKVDGTIGSNASARKPLIPASIERSARRLALGSAQSRTSSRRYRLCLRFRRRSKRV
jgi:hypothetical protein